MEDKTKKFGVLSSEITLNRIKRKLRSSKEHDGISIQELEITLLCPIGKVKMALPGRTDKCKHLQCFDATRYIDMNKITKKFNCPICNSYSKEVILDELFMYIISRVPKDCTKIMFNKNGSWSSLSDTQTFNSMSETRFNKMSKKRPLEITLEDIPDENTSLQDVTLPKEVKNISKSINKQFLSCKNNSYVSSSQSDASIGFNPILIEAYSLSNLAVSSLASNSKLPLINLEPDKPISIKISAVASADGSVHTSFASFSNLKPPVINLDDEPTSTKTSTVVVASTQESVPSSLASDSNLRPSVIELKPDEPTSTKTSTVAKAQESGHTYRLDLNSYLEYLKVSELEKKNIPWKRCLEMVKTGSNSSHSNLDSVPSNSSAVASASKIPNQNNAHITTDEDSDLEIIEQSSEALTSRASNPNLKNNIDPSAPTAITSSKVPNKNSEPDLDTDIIIIE